MRSRERACTCLHRVWCSQSRSCLLSRQCGTFLFSVRGAVWRRVCGRSPPPCPKGATSTSALTARFAHLPVCTCRGGPVPFGTILLPFREFATAECVSLSSRVTRGESSIRLTPPGESSIRLTPVKKGDPASGYTFGRSSIRLLPVLATNQWLALHQHNRLTSSPRKRNKSKNQRTREWCLSPSPSDHSLKVPTQVHHL